MPWLEGIQVVEGQDGPAADARDEDLVEPQDGQRDQQDHDEQVGLSRAEQSPRLARHQKRAPCGQTSRGSIASRPRRALSARRLAGACPANSFDMYPYTVRTYSGSPSVSVAVHQS